MEQTNAKKWMEYHESADARNALSSLTRHAWEESMRLGVDYENALPETIPPSAWENIKRQTKRLYIYAGSLITPLLRQNRDENLGVLLFNIDGTLLRMYGGDSFQAWAKRNRIVMGTRWSENRIGANVFSMGIRRERGTLLRGAENFSRFLISGAYYFSPIKLENGDPYGGIALAVPIAHQNDYILPLTVAIARAIELQLFWFNIIELYSEITEGYGMMSLDQSNGRNHILTMSGEIFKMLKIPKQDSYYNELENLIDPLPSNQEFWEIVGKKTKVTDKSLQIMVKGKPSIVSMSTSSFKEDKFHMNGFGIAMNSLKRINKLVSKYAGNSARYKFGDIIGQSKPCVEAIDRSRSAAKTDSNILLLGESGVGKDIVAQAIHNSSARADGPFVAVNCASFSKELISSELFGYDSGAYTGAKKEGNIGKFELANNGTLFLDEIGDMPLDLQAVLLRVLESKSFMKVGGNKLIRVNVRIIAATNKNLLDKIKHGLFREDLFYRLGIVRIQIPPLRERGGDALLLAEHFATQICARLGKPRISIAKDAALFFQRYPWPGNVRELQNLLEGIISTCNDPVVYESTIRHYLGDVGFQLPGSGVAEEKNLDNHSREREAILDALSQCRNNRTKAAELLGIPRRTLYRRLKEYGIL